MSHPGSAVSLSSPRPQGLIGSTLLVAVPNELTREVLQTQVKDALDDALRTSSPTTSAARSASTRIWCPLHEEPEPAPSNCPATPTASRES